MTNNLFSLHMGWVNRTRLACKAGWEPTVLIYNAWTTAQARSLSHSTTRAPSLLRSPACLSLWQCWEPSWLPIGYRFILWVEPLNDEEAEAPRAQLGLFTLREAQKRGWEREIDMRKLGKASMKILSHVGYSGSVHTTGNQYRDSMFMSSVNVNEGIRP